MFDGPQRAIRCAMAIRDAVQALGIQVRAGLHTGECEVRGDDIGGIGVHIGTRVSALAGANDVLVSGTLRDLVIGSGLEFDDRGAHELKGVPGEWHLFAVASPQRWVAAKLISPAVSSLCTRWQRNAEGRSSGDARLAGRVRLFQGQIKRPDFRPQRPRSPLDVPFVCVTDSNRHWTHLKSVENRRH